MDRVEVAHSAIEGRHLLARQRIPAGKEVLRVKPFAAVLYDDQVPKRCAFCFQEKEHLMRCSMSKFAYFCSKEHQRMAWTSGYKQEAEALAACKGRIPPPTLRLCAQVIWKKAREADSAGASSFEAVTALLDHWSEIDDERKATYAQMAVVVRQYMQGCRSLPDAATALDLREVALLLARFACNNHTMCDEELRPFGVGLYPLAALANHSCNPSCMQSFQGGDIVFRALKNLSPGGPVTISYIELAATWRERRENLQYLYFFDIDQTDTTAQHNIHDQLQRLQCSDARDPRSDAAGNNANGTTSCQDGVSNVTFKAPIPQAEWQLPCDYRLQWFGTAAEPPWAFESRDVLLTQVLSSQTRRPMQGGLEVCSSNSSTTTRTNNSNNNTNNSNSNNSISNTTNNSTKNDTNNSTNNSTTTNNNSNSNTTNNSTNNSINNNTNNNTNNSINNSIKNNTNNSNSNNTNNSTNNNTNHDTNNSINNSINSSTNNAMDASEADDHAWLLSMATGTEPNQGRVLCWGPWTEELGSLAKASNCQHLAGFDDQGPSAPHATTEAGRWCQTMAEVAELTHQAEGLTQKGELDKAISLLRSALSVVDGTSNTYKLGPHHLLRLRINSALMKASIDHGRSWQTALDAARALAPPFELVYPDVWPNLALHWAAVSKLENLVGKEEDALMAADHATRIMNVTHPDSAVLTEQLQLRHDLQRSLRC